MGKSNYHWYILSVRGGKEEKVLEKIKLELKNNQQDNKVSDLKIIKNNEQKKIKGFIFCYACLDKELLQTFYKVSEVFGFLNHSKKSDKLPNFVSEKVIKTFSASTPEPKKMLVDNSASLKTGDLVKITKGPLAKYEVIKVVKVTGQKVSIEIEFAGKKTLIDNVPIDTISKVLN